MSAAPAIELTDVEFGWLGSPALLRIRHLAIAGGECVFLRGPSGSGKSTLLGLVGGVLTPARGEVKLLGTDIARLGAAQRDRFRGEHLGFIFQMFNLIPYLTAFDNVLLPARFSARRAAQAGAPRAEALRLLDALGLNPEDVVSRDVSRLSIGQQQRVAAARALLGKPDIVIADEPTSALDADARAAFIALLMGQCRAQGATLLFVSHDASLQPLFDRGIAMADLNDSGAAA